MPKPGFIWRHVTINTKRSWFHGDQRGFRSRGHRIHSSGDYKNPPPAGEHANLNRWHKHRSPGPLVIPVHLRPVIRDAIIDKMEDQGIQWLAIAVAGEHAHVLAELPVVRRQTKKLVGLWKQAASHTVRHELPGGIWADLGDYKLVETRAHQREAYGYILTKQGPGAVTASFRDRAV